MKYYIQHIIFGISALLMAFSMESCDTDHEPVKVKTPGISNQNPELYARYLSALRTYKSGKHKIVFGWFDNSEKIPASQGQNIIAVPDSLDYLVLTLPENLNDRELSEMKEIKEKKGIHTLFEINFIRIKEDYDAKKEAFEDNPDNAGKIFNLDFRTYLVDKVQKRLKLCSTFNYDGVVMTFYAKTKLYMTEKEKTAQRTLENIFLGIAKDWKQRHPDKVLALAGKPQNVDDKSVFDLCEYIIIPCQASTSASDIVYSINKAVVEGVPNNKIIPLVSMYSKDKTDTKTGYWGKSLSVLGTAKLAAQQHTDYQIIGLAIDNANNDYYHVRFVYPTIREAISIMNPIVKI